MSDPIIGPAILLATEILKFVNTSEAKKYEERLTDIDLSLNAELQKNFDSQDDKKIVRLKRERAIIMKAAHGEFLRYVSGLKK